jgi:hypothetical protein
MRLRTLAAEDINTACKVEVCWRTRCGKVALLSACKVPVQGIRIAGLCGHGGRHKLGAFGELMSEGPNLLLSLGFDSVLY